MNAIAIICLQWVDEPILEQFPAKFSSKLKKGKDIAHLNVWITICLIVLSVPYIFPLFTQGVHKLFVMSSDYEYFKGHDSLK